MKSSFNLDDASSAVQELVGIIYDTVQHKKFIDENKEALESKNPMRISDRLEYTEKEYKTPITIFSTISNLADEIAPRPPKTTTCLPMSACKSCLWNTRQEATECIKCRRLSYFTSMIPVYAVMQKAGEKGIDWGVDRVLKLWVAENSITFEESIKIKERSNVWRTQQF